MPRGPQPARSSRLRDPRSNTRTPKGPHTRGRSSSPHDERHISAKCSWDQRDLYILLRPSKRGRRSIRRASRAEEIPENSDRRMSLGECQPPSHGRRSASGCDYRISPRSRRFLRRDRTTTAPRRRKWRTANPTPSRVTSANELAGLFSARIDRRLE